MKDWLTPTRTVLTPSPDERHNQEYEEAIPYRVVEEPDYLKDSRLRMARGLKQRCLTEQMCSILITETVDNIPTRSMMNMETAAMKELDDIITTNMEEGQEDDMHRQLVVVEWRLTGARSWRSLRRNPTRYGWPGSDQIWG